MITQLYKDSTRGIGWEEENLEIGIRLLVLLYDMPEVCHLVIHAGHSRFLLNLRDSPGVHQPSAAFRRIFNHCLLLSMVYVRV
jgi:hypothetical protein